jgi:hypothetical protein
LGIGIGIEGWIYDGAKTQWIKEYLNVTGMLWSLGIKAFLV